MGYETYFNEERYGNALVNPRQNPKSADKYVALFGANSPAIGQADPRLVADLNKDGKVNIVDLSRLLTAWGTPAADLDGSGSTGITDLSRLLTAWTR